MDDDVQYLGMKVALPEPLDRPCETQGAATGITLHIQKCGEKPAHELTFHRSRSSYVNIGRKSGSDDKSMRRENDDHNAVFACQVVSARHAKLVLSDSGQVYIIDLHSRHGTHLLKGGETIPKTLKAEVETALADGDILTFGKTVGAGTYLVSPVTVRVELLRESSPRLSRPLTPVIASQALARKLSSGRYGLFAPTPYPESSSPHSSSSSYEASEDCAFSQSDRDSDIEEVSCSSFIVRDKEEKSLPAKIPTFRSFINDIYASRLSTAKDTLHSAIASPSSSLDVSPPSPVVVVINPTSTSRPCSPMEMSTPSPLPPTETHHCEPAVVGAWPASRPQSPERPANDGEPEKADVPINEHSEDGPSTDHTGATDNFSESLSHELIDLRPLSFFPVGGPFSNSMATAFGCNMSLPSPSVDRLTNADKLPEHVVTELKMTIKSVEERVASLQETIADVKSRQCLAEEDILDLQTHVDMLEPESDRLLVRINAAERNVASFSGLQSQVNDLRNRLDAAQPRPLDTPLGDLKACAEALNAFVSEMKILRKDAVERMEEKIEAINVARAESLSAITVEIESLKSLKRKRDDDDDRGDTINTVTAQEDSINTSVDQLAPQEVLRRPKRAKTTVYTVARTAAAMAVGAVATWSALAFS